MDRTDRAQVRDISKRIKQGIRNTKRSKKHLVRQVIIEEFKGFRTVANTKDRKKKVLIVHMRNKLGSIEATRKSFSNVLAKFYKFIYSNKNDEAKDKHSSEAGPENTCHHSNDDIQKDEQDRHLPEITRKDLTAALNSLKKRKSADSRGIMAEEIKEADEKTTTMMHEFFNLIMTQTPITPSSCKRAMITVIYKKSDVTNPENYRPITGLQQLYKLFSTMLATR